MKKKICTILGAVAMAFLTFGCSGTLAVGLINGKLAPCPSSPNCVSSAIIEGKNSIVPLSYKGDALVAEEKLIAVLNSMKRVRIVTCKDGYIHAEFTSAVFRFVDDVEFYISGQEKLIHFRSASRIGYSDFGANRKRMEEIRILFEKKSVQ